MLKRLPESLGPSKFVLKKLAGALTVLIISFGLTACGGGGGVDDRETPATPVFPAVVFMADKDNDGTVELYASLDDSIDIIRLSNPLDPGGNVVDFKVSPDGLFVAYVADQAKDELFVVPVDKSASESAQKISGTPMAGGGLKKIAAAQYAFAWAPDSSRIAYLADQNTAGVVELFSNTPDGTDQTTVRLSVLSGIDRDVEDFAWSPDFNNSRKIAYRADQENNDVIELYTTLPAASASLKISTGLAPGSNVTAFKWAPNAEMIAFLADKINDEFKLYTTSPNNNANILVSGSLAATSDVKTFKWSPNSVRLAYVNQLSASGFQLFTTQRDQQPSTLISGDLRDAVESGYGWSADSSQIAYIADEDTADQFELYTSDPTTASAAVKVSGILVSGGDVTAFQWAPSALLLAYVADQDTNGIVELYTTNPPPNVAVIKVSKDPLAGLAVEDDFSWSPDSATIAYRADQDSLGTIELFTTNSDGSVNDKVSGTLAGGGNVIQFKWDGLGSAIGYLADQMTAGVTELFASLPDGSQNTLLSGPLAAGGDVSRFKWVPE
jgi:Tol biopolymer transport system component